MLLAFPTDPSLRQLRQFALLAALFVPMIGWWSGATATMTWAVLGMISMALAIIAGVRPNWMRWPFMLLMRLAAPIGWGVGELALLLLYFLVFLPIGWLLRMTGRDVLGKRDYRSDRTGWRVRSSEPRPDRYFQQF